MRDIDDWVDLIVDELGGTCKSLYEVLESHDRCDLENNFYFCAQLDSRIFQCDDCGWWDENCEMSNTKDWVCRECAQDED